MSMEGHNTKIEINGFVLSCLADSFTFDTGMMAKSLESAHSLIQTMTISIPYDQPPLISRKVREWQGQEELKRLAKSRVSSIRKRIRGTW